MTALGARPVEGTARQRTPSERVLAAKLRVPPATGIDRPRLKRLAERIGEVGLAVVSAPAGSGKTTFVAQLAHGFSGPVAWYRADTTDQDPTTVLAHLQRGVEPALGFKFDHPWTTIDDAITALDASARPCLVVVDDAHALAGTPAAGMLDRLVANRPASVTLVVTTRTDELINLTRLRLAGLVIEVTSDDLRFRSWEVEQLFHEQFGEPLRPEELAHLARSTEGWAAGLRLFHLATRGKPLRERQLILADLAGRSRLVREYLTRNVLDDLAPHVRSFLVRTAPLGHLTAELCDGLLGTRDSAAILRELSQRGVFTSTDDDGQTYRYHEVFRAQLEAELPAQLGAGELLSWYERAGELLEADGALADAVRVYCRAGAWSAVERVIGRRGPALSAGPGRWLDLLPAALSESDPWIALARARAALADGRLDDAYAAYGQAEAALPSEAGAVCRAERRALESWVSPQSLPSPDAASQVRRALSQEPARVAATLSEHPSPGRLLAAGLSHLAAGDLRSARQRLEAALAAPSTTALEWAGAQLTLAVVRVLVGDAPDAGQQLMDAAAKVELVDVRVLGSAAATLAHVAQRSNDGAGITGLPDDVHPWPAAVIAVAAAAVAVALATSAEPWISNARSALDELDAPVLRAWAAALALGAGGDHSDAGDVTAHVITLARSARAPGPEALARAHRELHERGSLSAATTADLESLGLVHLCRPAARLPPTALPAIRPAMPPQASRLDHGGVRRIDVRCFGTFSITVDGATVDLTSAKPRTRQVLRLVCVHAPGPVHRDRLVEALWPGSDPRAATHRLQVAVSALRRLVELRHRGAGDRLLERDGDVYRLGPTVDSDVATFRALVADGRHRQTQGDAAGAKHALRAGLDLYSGEALPEEGAADWIVGQREDLRSQALSAGLRLVELLADEHKHRSVASICERLVQIDPYSDEAWRALVAAHELSGDVMAARRARHGYKRALAELDVH